MKLLRCHERAAHLDELDFGSRSSLRLFKVDEVIDEFELARKALQIPAKVSPPARDLDDDEEASVIAALESGIDIVPALRRLATCPASWVAYRVHQVRQALRAARGAVDSNGSPTGCLLPALPHERLAFLIGSGVVPMAWVRKLDAARF
jgi:hypothetical protein